MGVELKHAKFQSSNARGTFLNWGLNVRFPTAYNGNG